MHACSLTCLCVRVSLSVHVHACMAVCAGGVCLSAGEGRFGIV